MGLSGFGSRVWGVGVTALRAVPPLLARARFQGGGAHGGGGMHWARRMRNIPEAVMVRVTRCACPVCPVETGPALAVCDVVGAQRRLGMRRALVLHPGRAGGVERALGAHPAGAQGEGVPHVAREADAVSVDVREGRGPGVVRAGMRQVPPRAVVIERALVTRPALCPHERSHARARE